MNLSVEVIKDLILARLYNEYGVKGQLWGVRGASGTSTATLKQMAYKNSVLRFRDPEVVAKRQRYAASKRFYRRNMAIGFGKSGGSGRMSFHPWNPPSSYRGGGRVTTQAVIGGFK